MGKNETKRRNQHTRDKEERMPKKQKENKGTCRKRAEEAPKSTRFRFILFSLESRNDYNIGKSPT